MQVEIRTMEPCKAVCMSHKGAYYKIGKTFGEIYSWFRETNTPINMGIALYYDDITVVPEDELNSDAGVFVEADFSTEDARVHVVEIAGGTYAVYTHIGSYATMHSSWQKLMEWLATSEHTPAQRPPFEIYVDDCDEVPEDQLRTDICIPLEG